MNTPEKKVNYLECDKGGFHCGQVLNMVCLEKTCSDNLACCCSCIESEHKKHNSMPLKMVMNEAKVHSQTLNTSKFNVDVVLDIINSSRMNTLEMFQKYRKEINTNLQKIEKLLIGYYTSTIEQVHLKNSDPKIQINKAFEIIFQPETQEQFKASVKRIVAMLPKKSEEVEMEMSEADLINSLTSSNEQLAREVTSNIDEINKKLLSYQTQLQKHIEAMNVWKTTQYKFSPTCKHTDVKLLSDTITKSANISGYKFSVMEPSLEKGGPVKVFSFKIRESSSNWVAIGMCHKKIVESKGYSFNFGTIGHGGYMISANGGSWSNIKAQNNNAIKAFKFVKGDIITVTADFQSKTITFQKKQESYKLQFQLLDKDELYPCVLFYYINDEVEFLPNYKE